MTKISTTGYPMGRVLYIPTGQYLKFGIESSYCEWVIKFQCLSIISSLVTPTKEHKAWAKIHQDDWLKFNNLPLNHTFSHNEFEIIYD